MKNYIKNLLIKLLCFFIFGASCSLNAEQRIAAIASAHPLATQAGHDALKQGGNAFDAAVAISATLAVVEPFGSGLGGGGFWLLHRGSDDMEIMIDGRETAPRLATADLFLDESGNRDKEHILNTPQGAAIYGVPAALEHISKKYGRLNFANTLEHAIRHAEQGFLVGSVYQKLAQYRKEVLRRFPESRSIFLDSSGEVPTLGSVIVQKDLANSLRVLAREGSADFYSGQIAQIILTAIQRDGGVWQRDDLEKYRIKERKPTVFWHRGARIVSAPPPSSGGLVLAEIFGILSQYDYADYAPISRTHLFIEAMRRGYHDRALWLGDPDFTSIPYQRFMNKAVVQSRAKSIDLQRATPSSDFSRIVEEGTGTQTTHFSIIDAEGNWVSATLSINLPFGSGYVIPGTGILLNNEMDDFAVSLSATNSYGLVGREANQIEAGKRPLSSMSPTFVERGNRVGVLGSPGGSRIISIVFHGIQSYLQNQAPSQWVRQPRWHHQYLPDVVLHEKEAFDDDMASALKALGHNLQLSSRQYGNMQVVLWDGDLQRFSTANDPRGEGASCICEY